MANRRLARSIVLQSLFEWDTAGVPEEKLEEVLKRNAKEFGTSETDEPFMENLFRGVLAKHADIDLIITKAAPQWPLDRIAPIDRNVLRIGLYELLFADRTEVPAKVAINEAIELAKTFGGDTAGRFVNGVLGGVYKEIGEPGKFEVGKHDKHLSPDIPTEQLGGAVVYAKHDGQYYFALVHDIFGKWTLSKGRVKHGESIEDGTIREVKEEMSADIEIEEMIGENEYTTSHPERGKMRKHVTYFIARAPYEPLKLEAKKGGLDDVKWFRLTEILSLNFYEDLLPIVTAAMQKILDRSRTSEA